MDDLAPPYPMTSFYERGEQIIYVKAPRLCFGCRRLSCEDRDELVCSCTRYDPRVPRRTRG